MRKLMFSLFIRTYRSLQDKRLGKLPLVRRIVDVLYNNFKPPGNITLLELQDYKMFVNPQDMAIPRQLITYGHYEKYETELFKKFVKEGYIVVDIGAHIGHYTLIAAGLVGKKGHVFSFEPFPDSYDLLVKNLEINGYPNVTPVQKAISNKIGLIKLFLNMDDTGSHTICGSSNAKANINMQTTTLDDFFKDKESRINLLKMDVEGAEMLVLEGMEELLKNNQNLTIFTEFSPDMLKRADCSPGAYLNQLVKYGFKLFYINEKEKKLEPVDAAKALQIGLEEKLINFLCLKEK